MTLDEAIKHADEVAEEKKKDACELYDAENYEESRECIWCAEEHRQLAEWLKELKQLREQTRWISVSERLPEDGQNVLFCDIDDDVMLGYHVKGRPNTHFTRDMIFENIKNVKAWMPLPEPYKAESEVEE